MSLILLVSFILLGCHLHRLIIVTALSTLSLTANCLSESTNIDVGLCYETEGNENLAQAAYERALIEDEKDINARFKLARLYNAMGMKKEAALLVENVKKMQLTPAQRTSLAAIQADKDASLNTLNIRANLYLGYDSNVNVSPSPSIIQETNTSADGVQSSLFLRVKADLSYLHDLGTAGGWFLRTDANLYYQNNSSAHYYDVAYGRLYAGGGHRSTNYTLYIPLFYDRIHYLDRDLLQEYGVRPDLTLRLVDTLFLNLNATYTQRRYIQSIDVSRNDNTLSGGAGLFWLGSTHMMYGKLRYENYDATEASPAAFTDNSQFYAMIGGIYSLSNLADLELNYQYRYGDYAKVANVKRDDSNHDISVIAKHNFTKYFRANIDYRYVNNQSSYDLAKYEKHEAMLGIEYNY